MNFRLLIFIPATCICSHAFAQDTTKIDVWIDSMWYDPQWETFGEPVDNTTPIELPDVQLSDSIARGIDTTAMLTHDTGICVSILIELTSWVDSSSMNFVELTPITSSYMWTWSPAPRGLVYPDDWWTSGYKVIVTDPYKTTVGLSMMDTTPLRDSSTVLYIATNPKVITPVPPIETPEPSKPATNSNQPWYEAILPSSSRPRKNT
jgi:hypothetical protein